MKKQAQAKKREAMMASTKPRKREFGEYKFPDVVRRDENVEYRSLNSSEFNTSRKETMKYTGTLIKGIGTMHKSNAVPVLNEEEARDLATMRRN